MTPSLLALALSAMTISIIHTVSGPDHYLPLIVFSRTRKWSLRKTIGWTILCGFGHIFATVVIGLLGVYLGWELSKQSWVQDIRGNLSGWSLLILGGIYLVWGLYKAFRGTPHKHFDVTENNEIYVYKHSHDHATARPGGEAHHHDHAVKVTPWILFMIFIMAPNDPMLPLLFYSGTRQSAVAVVVLILTFMLTKTLVMLTMVLLGCFGCKHLHLHILERFAQAIGGAVVTACGVGVVFLGW